MEKTPTSQRTTNERLIEHRLFKGSFEHPKFKFQAKFYIDEISRESLFGKIVWQLEKSPHADEQSKVGLTAIEYVSGKFSPNDGLLELTGYAIDDPNQLNIALDKYALKLTKTGREEELSGGTTAHTDGVGKVNMVGIANDSAPPIVLDRKVGCNVEELWSLWTEDEKLKKWLAEDAKVSTKLGAKYELFWEPEHPERNSTKDCIVLSLAPQKELAFTWRGPVPFSEIMNSWPPPTYVRVRFSSLDKEHSKVELTHYGWGTTDKWVEAKTWQKNAWRSAFERMY